jgi:hypothetical protein
VTFLPEACTQLSQLGSIPHGTLWRSVPRKHPSNITVKLINVKKGTYCINSCGTKWTPEDSAAFEQRYIGIDQDEDLEDIAALFEREDAGAVLFKEWEAYREVPLEYSHGDDWERLLRQGIGLLEQFARDNRIHIRQPGASDLDWLDVLDD